MAVTIFPSSNDVAPVINDGRVPTEESISRLQELSYPQRSRVRRAGSEQFETGGVVSGYGVSSIAGLVVTLAAGQAVIQGYHITDSATRATPALTPSVFNWVFLALTKSASLVTGIEIQVSTSSNFAGALTSVPADAILLHVFETNATDVITQLDFTSSPSNCAVGSYVGDGAASRTIDLGFRPKLVALTKLTAPRLWCYSEMAWPFPTSKQYGVYHHERTTGAGLATGISNSRENRPQLESNGFSVEDGPATVVPGGVMMVRETYDPPSLGVGAADQHDVTVTGAVVNDHAIAQHENTVNAEVKTEAVVTAPDNVRVTFRNLGGTVNIASGELIVTVFTQPSATNYRLNELNAFYFFTAWY